MHDDTFDKQALNDALRRGDIRALDTLGFLVSFDDVEMANAQHARLIGRGVETFTELETKQAFVNWILAGKPRE
jgi:hypothetical protein